GFRFSARRIRASRKVTTSSRTTAAAPIHRSTFDDAGVTGVVVAVAGAVVVVGGVVASVVVVAEEVVDSVVVVGSVVVEASVATVAVVSDVAVSVGVVSVGVVSVTGGGRISTVTLLPILRRPSMIAKPAATRLPASANRCVTTAFAVASARLPSFHKK